MRSRKFYSRQNLLYVVVGSVVLYALILTLHVAERQYESNQLKKQADIERRAMEAIPAAEKAISRAEKYLANNIIAVDPAARLILDYLQRKFDLNEDLSITRSTPKQLNSKSLQGTEIDYIARIGFPDRIQRQAPGVITGDISYINIYSTNCDHLDLPTDYWQKMQKFSKAGGYLRTHVVLGFEFMEDLECGIPPIGMDTRDQAIDGLIDIATDESNIPDLRYEAIALLLLNNREEQVQAEWIEDIIAAQDGNGGWAEQSAEGKVTGHATLLALWALLESSRPDVADEPLIRHESKTTDI